MNQTTQAFYASLAETRLADAATKFDTAMRTKKRYKKLHSTERKIEMALTDRDVDVQLFAAVLPIIVPAQFDNKAKGELLKIYQHRLNNLMRIGKRSDDQNFISNILFYLSVPSVKS